MAIGTTWRRARGALLSLTLVLAVLHPSVAAPDRSPTPTAPSTIATSFFVALLMMAAGGGPRMGAGNPKRTLYLDHSLTLEAIGVDTAWADTILKKTGCTYLGLAAELHNLLAFMPEFEQPSPVPDKPFTRPQDSSDPRQGNKFNVPLHERIVQVETDRYLHFCKSLEVNHTELDTRRKYSLPAACRQALQFMLRKGRALGPWRLTQMEKLQSISNRLKPLDAALKKLPIALQSESVRSLDTGVANPDPNPRKNMPHPDGVRSVDVGIMCLVGDVIQWPDTALPRGYLTGFRVTGDIAASGVLRPKAPSNTPQEFWAGYHRTMRSNHKWAKDLANEVSLHAKAASGKRLQLLRKAWSLTADETAAGYSGAGMTLKQLESKYGTGSSMRCRPIGRHAIRQGWKQLKDANGVGVTDVDGSPTLTEKFRLIDDSKRSLSNGFLQRLCETIAPCRFDYLGYVADELVSLCEQRGEPVPCLVFSMDDMQ